MQRAFMLGVLLFIALCTLANVRSTTSVAHAASVSSDDVVTWIRQYAREYGVNEHYMLLVAWCESEHQPYAIGKAGEVGPLQFHPRGIWWSTPYGKRGIRPDQVSVDEQIRMAVMLFSQGYNYHWSCK